MKKCVFFDRDGVVNASPGAGYVERWSDFHLLPEFVAALREVRRLGFEAVIVTNQKGVAKGILTMETLNDIHARLRRTLLEQHGQELLDIRACPHGDDECECRKPKPGMLLDAARIHGIDLRTSWMVGDSSRDVEAGRRAGCRTIFVGAADSAGADHVVPDMKVLAVRIGGIVGNSAGKGSGAI